MFNLANPKVAPDNASPSGAKYQQSWKTFKTSWRTYAGKKTFLEKCENTKLVQLAFLSHKTSRVHLTANSCRRVKTNSCWKKSSSRGGVRWSSTLPPLIRKTKHKHTLPAAGWLNRRTLSTPDIIQHHSTQKSKQNSAISRWYHPNTAGTINWPPYIFDQSTFQDQR